MKKDFLQSLFEYLSSNKELNKIVGDNIFPMFIPQYDKIPALVYYPVSIIYDTEFEKDSDFVKITIQFDCHEKTFKKARTLSRLIKKMFQDYHGDMYGTNIQAVFIKNDIIINDNLTNKFDTLDSIHILEFEFFI